MTSLLVPAQQGHAQGDPGTLILPYTLDGTVSIDWGEVFVGGFLVSGATARMDWSYTSFAIDDSLFTSKTVANFSWSGNHVSDSVSENVNLIIPFLFGQIFYLSEAYEVIVDGHSGAAPAVGFVQLDFLHTGMLGPAIVEDGQGNALTGAIILSDTGFDFTNPQGTGSSAVPEPRGIALLAAVLALLFGSASRLSLFSRKRSPERRV